MKEILLTDLVSKIKHKFPNRERQTLAHSTHRPLFQVVQTFDDLGNIYSSRVIDFVRSMSACLQTVYLHSLSFVC